MSRRGAAAGRAGADGLDWATLTRLRGRFLDAAAPAGDYWTSRADLDQYERTFAQRIAWKWDAVLGDGALGGWRPPPGLLLDWGCGSGIAGRRVLARFGVHAFAGLRVCDRSPLAESCALEAARAAHPGLDAAAWRDGAGGAPPGLLVVSHVLNELDGAALEGLLALAERAAAVLWVEPGASDTSRALGRVRERLRGRFRIVAPCPHAGICGMEAPENERHWCHFFAAPPPGIFADSGWVRFAQRAGIDLRSLPYAFLALDRRAAPAGPAEAVAEREPVRIVGRPRLYKGYAKILACRAAGLGDLTLFRRDAPALFKAMKDPLPPELHRWRVIRDRIAVAPPGALAVP